jgi:hypothetical protein
MEEPTSRPSEEVFVPAFIGFDVHVVPGCASPAGYDKELAVHLEALVSVTVAAEEKAGLTETKERIGKEGPDFFPAPGDCAIRKWRAMAAHDHTTHLLVLFEPLQLGQIPVSLLIRLLSSEGGEV